MIHATHEIVIKYTCTKLNKEFEIKRTKYEIKILYDLNNIENLFINMFHMEYQDFMYIVNVIILI